MNRLNDFSNSSVPALFQHVYDRMLNNRGPEDTPSKALKCMGLFNVIARLRAQGQEVTHGTLAKSVGLTFPGVLRPLAYLKKLELIDIHTVKQPGASNTVQHIEVPEPFVRHTRLTLRRIEGASDRWRRETSPEAVSSLFHEAYTRMLDERGPKDTAGKALKSIGLINVMARVRALGTPLTRPALAKFLGVSDNTLCPQVEYLARFGLITLTLTRPEHRLGQEYKIQIPDAFVIHTRRSLRRLETELVARGCETPNRSGFAEAPVD